MSRPDDASLATFEDKTQKETFVRGTFDAIAPRYDLLNRVMSMSLDRSWRRAAAALVEPRADGTYLDVGCGTGDLALAVLRRAPGARVVGVDLARAMLVEARRKAPALETAHASALALPFPDRSMDGALDAFVLRNLADLDAFFQEARRVLKPGARLVNLEIGRPRGRVFGPLYRFYFYRVMPRFGRALSGNSTAYQYLADSVKVVETPEAIAERMRRAGFADVRVRSFMRGAVAAIHGRA
ncbi:MAG TPA: ubiquinone/menaquinone biosynthesis methyltransferase [Candidatus Thermoplasmatota archaeon]|nr:ubiquinone/menaquinone biosynthesis methyltransferase [Candidatus Thermoplasmatota archaeon]